MKTAFTGVGGTAPDEFSQSWVVAATVPSVHATFDRHDLLDEAERVKAARFVRPDDGERYRAAHLLKRHLLGAATGHAPQDLRFDCEPSGKPVLRQAVRPDFNLSHGGDWVVAGVSWSGRIGVDVEAQRPLAFWREIAGAFLAPAERTVANRDDHLKIWTAKEAGLKAHGAGFTITPDEITVTGSGDGFRMEIRALDLRGGWQWVDDAHLLAVATSGAMPQIAVCRSTGDLGAALGRIRPPAQGWLASD